MKRKKKSPESRAKHKCERVHGEDILYVFLALCMCAIPLIGVYYWGYSSSSDAVIECQKDLRVAQYNSFDRFVEASDTDYLCARRGGYKYCSIIIDKGVQIAITKMRLLQGH